MSVHVVARFSMLSCEGGVRMNHEAYVYLFMITNLYGPITFLVNLSKKTSSRLRAATVLMCEMESTATCKEGMHSRMNGTTIQFSQGLVIY